MVSKHDPTRSKFIFLLLFLSIPSKGIYIPAAAPIAQSEEHPLWVREIAGSILGRTTHQRCLINDTSSSIGLLVFR